MLRIFTYKQEKAMLETGCKVGKCPVMVFKTNKTFWRNLRFLASLNGTAAVEQSVRFKLVYRIKIYIKI